MHFFFKYETYIQPPWKSLINFSNLSLDFLSFQCSQLYHLCQYYFFISIIVPVTSYPFLTARARISTVIFNRSVIGTPSPTLLTFYRIILTSLFRMVKGIKCIVTEDLMLGGEHTVQYKSDVLLNFTLGTYVILLFNVIPISLI